MKLDLKIPWQSKDEETRKNIGSEFYGIRDIWNQHNDGVVRWDNYNATNATITNLTAAGNVNLNNFKIQNLANGTASSDAAAFGQLPTIVSGTFTPAPNGQGTVTNAVGFYQQIGSMVHAWGTFKSGTETGAIFSMPVPVGSIVYTNRAATDGSTFCGWIHLMFGSRAIGSANLGVAFLDGSDTTNVYFGSAAPATGSAAWPKTLGTAWNNTTYFSFDFWFAVA